MELFKWNQKQEEGKPSACSCDAHQAEPCACDCDTKEADCHIQVLGSGCKNCHALLEATKAAVSKMGLSANVDYVTDMEVIMSYGILSMPALVVNEKVVSMGRVLKMADVENLLHQLGY